MRRIGELDALRGVAAIVIVLFHLRAMNYFPLWGTAVDLFFVLSGYLITTILLQMPRTAGGLATFYARRALRIWPIYYLGIALVFAVNALIGVPQSTKGLGYYLTYTQLIPCYWREVPATFSQLYLHTWTLAIEEQFYLLWPLLVLLLGRRFVLLGVAPLLWLPMWLRARGLAPCLLLTRCDGLALGALLAWFYLDQSRAERYRWLSRGSAALLIVATLSFPLWRGPIEARMYPWWVNSIEATRITLFHGGVVALVLALRGHWLLAPLRNAQLKHLGIISYGLYLYHPFVFAVVEWAAKRVGLWDLTAIDVLKLGGTWAVAALSWRFIEQPLLRLKDRFSYAQVAASQAAPLFHGSHFGRIDQSHSASGNLRTSAQESGQTL